MTENRRKKSERLLGILDKYAEVVVIMHNNPDPDAMAAGWALTLMIHRKLHKPVRLIARGPVLRAENLQFLKLLEPPVQLIDEYEKSVGHAPILIDCSPGAQNHLLGGRQAPVAVVDHHESRGDGFRIRFRDARPHVTASASIVTRYLREQRIEPTSKLATALVYAIRTEMIGSHKPLARIDHSALRWLSGYADYDVLAAIENPPLPQSYYEEMLLGLDRVLSYSDCALCFLPRLRTPETVAEFADLLIRCEGLTCVLCAGRIGDDLMLSARSQDEDRAALSLLGQVLEGIGHFGGHRHRAAGSVSMVKTGREPSDLEQCVRHRWLEACGCGGRRGRRLVRRRELDRRQ
ncbi:MAG: DHH family phosphoesterase [Planctomycetota bacterium]|jgi:nanoRNase/pAp phosphatase (c-di-AMP/oligoRNAs hydrolase)